MNTSLHNKNIACISKEAIAGNYRTICRHLAEGCSGQVPQVIATVKANGYGHGVDTMTQVLGDEGCGFFAVSSEREALEVRALEENRGRHPAILILGYTFPENVPMMVGADIACTAVSPAHGLALAEAAKAAGMVLKIHIKLDTGMHRVGFACDTADRRAETVAAIASLSHHPHLQIGGIFTHFSCCDDEMLDGLLAPGETVPLTETQFARYKAVVDGLVQEGVDVGIRHAANSAAILGYVPAWLDAVRAGIILYGLAPDGKPWGEDDGFAPVMTLETCVAHIQTLLPGEHVSYGATYTATEPRTVATLPIGYADGWIRAYAGAFVTIGDGRFPVIGRICMDQCMVDITGWEERIHVGDKVVLFGGDRGESLAALAKKAGTIVYECTCHISERVPRIPQG